MRVLLADDDPEITRVLSIALRAAGHEVRIVQDALQAFLRAKKEPPDVILLDISMPGGNGADVLQLLKRSAFTRKIPVVIISASADADLPARVKKLGALQFIAKPFEFAQVQECLATLTSKLAG